MTESDEDVEVGRTLREYKEQSERLGCLLSRMQRMALAVENVQKAVNEGGGALTLAAENAVRRVEDGNIGSVFASIAETSKAKERLYNSLHQQGVGRLICHQ